MLSAFARLVRERPPGSASVLLACTVDEEFTHTGSSRLAEIRPRGRAGDRRRADLARPGALPQGRPAVEDPHPGASPATARRPTGGQRDLPDGHVLEALETFAGTLVAIEPHPMLGPPTLSVGRIEGGQSVNVVPDWCEIEVDRRLIPGEDAGHAWKKSGSCSRSVPGGLDWIEFGQPWVHMPALRARADEWLEPLRERHRRGDRPPARRQGRPVRHRCRSAQRRRNPLRRLRARRHRPGPHQGRVDRPRAGHARRRGLLSDRLPTRRCSRGMNAWRRV